MNAKPPAYAKTLVDPAVKNRRVLSALQVVLERVTLEADTEDADSLEDADALLRALDDLMGPARAARIQDRARLKREQSMKREREALTEEIERSRILGIEPEIGPAKPEAAVHEPSKDALAKAEESRTAEPRKVQPTPPDGETVKATERWRAHKAEQKKARAK